VKSGARNVTLEPIRFDRWQQELQSMKGRIVVVDVWATWCAPCIERFPHMVALYRQYKDRGVTFVVQGIPAVFLYDRSGRRRYNLNGDDPNHQATPKDVDDAVAALVAEK
jgi:thiol-disulfide isomerase/thioredoxin